MKHSTIPEFIITLGLFSWHQFSLDKLSAGITIVAGLATTANAVYQIWKKKRL